MGKETGILVDYKPTPPPPPLPPTPDFQLAQRLVQSTEAVVTARWKNAVKLYYENLLKLASGEVAEENLGERVQSAVALLRKTPQAIALDLSEARSIVSARRWLASHDENVIKAQIVTEAQTIAKFDSQLQNAISQLRSRAAPHHARLGELQAVERGFIVNAATARGWDHWIEGRFEVSPENLDRARAAL